MADEKTNYIYYGDFDYNDYKNKNPHLKCYEKEQIYIEYINELSKQKVPIYFTISPKKKDPTGSQAGPTGSQAGPTGSYGEVLLQAEVLKEISENLIYEPSKLPVTISNIHEYKNHLLYVSNNLNVSYDDFPWKSYIILNKDLKKRINTKENAWKHWLNHGKKEERPFSLINNTNNNRNRLGNLFFANMYLHFLALKFDLQCNYRFEDKFNQLGIFFYCGNKIYSKNLLITRKNHLYVLETNNNIMPANIISITKNFYQNKSFCLVLQNYFKKEEARREIINKNIFKKRYGNNNDLFLHIRLGDVADRIQQLTSYYEKMLNTISYKNAYISSDTIDSCLCRNLIEKYHLIVFDRNEIETIMFGSTCKHIVLTGGTFSWLIGFFAFYAEGIYYPKMENNKKWFGEIFNFHNCVCVSNF